MPEQDQRLKQAPTEKRRHLFKSRFCFEEGAFVWEASSLQHWSHHFAHPPTHPTPPSIRDWVRCAVFEMIKWNSEESGSHTDKEWLKERMELRWKHFKCWRRQSVKEAAGRFLSNRCKILAQWMMCLLTKKSPPPRRPGPACWSGNSLSWQALKPKLGDYRTRHVNY